MSAEQRDFSDFLLGDNVYELAGGVIPDIARELDVPLADEPNSEDIQAVLDVLGRQEKELRENPDVLIGDRDMTADLIERAGTQRALSRSLWTPDIAATADTVDRRLAFGGVANWTDRTGNVLVNGPKAPIDLLGGSRVMAQPTEVVNPNVVSLQDQFGALPNEMQYLAKIILPRLTAANLSAEKFQYNNITDADVMLARYFAANPERLKERLSLVRIANAGVIMALQVRAAARAIDPTFDNDKDNPQMFVETDAFPVSRTEENDKQPAAYQKAATGIKQVVLAAKKLHEAGDR